MITFGLIFTDALCIYSLFGCFSKSGCGWLYLKFLLFRMLFIQRKVYCDWNKLSYLLIKSFSPIIYRSLKNNPEDLRSIMGRVIHSWNKKCQKHWYCRFSWCSFNTGWFCCELCNNIWGSGTASRETRRLVLGKFSFRLYQRNSISSEKFMKWHCVVNHENGRVQSVETVRISPLLTETRDASEIICELHI